MIGRDVYIIIIFNIVKNIASGGYASLYLLFIGSSAALISRSLCVILCFARLVLIHKRRYVPRLCVRHAPYCALRALSSKSSPPVFSGLAFAKLMWPCSVRAQLDCREGRYATALTRDSTNTANTGVP